MKRVLIGASCRASDHVVGRPPGGRRHAEAGRRVAPPGDGVVSAQHRRGELQWTRVRLRHRQRGALPAHRGRPPGGRQVNHALRRRSRAAVKSHRAISRSAKYRVARKSAAHTDIPLMNRARRLRRSRFNF